MENKINKEKVSKYLRKNAEENTLSRISNLPVVMKYKNSKKEILFHNFNTGITADTLDKACPDKNCFIFEKNLSNLHDVHFYENNKKSNIKAIDILKSTHLRGVVYDSVTYNINGKNITLLVVYECKFDCKYPTENEKREWQEINRFYLDIEKNFYLKDRNSRYYEMYEGEDYDDYCYFQYYNLLNINNPIATWKEYHFDNNLFNNAKIFNGGAIVLSGNDLRLINNGYTLHQYLKNKESLRKETKKQEKIDLFNTYEFEELKIPSYKIPKFIDSCTFDDNLFFLNISEVKNSDNNKICCIRFCINTMNSDAYESCRIFIHENGDIVACKKNNFGEWISISLSLNMEHWQFPLKYVNKKAIKGTLLEYLSPMFIIKSKNAGVLIASAIANPWVEKFYKSEYKEIIKILTNSPITSDLSIKKSVEEHFGKIDISGKNIYSIIGVNKNQLEYLKDKIILNKKEISPIVKILKKIFNKDILNDIDISSVIAICEFLNKLDIYEKNYEKVGVFSSIGERIYSCNCKFYFFSENYNMIKILILITKMYSFKTTINMLDKLYYLYTSWVFIEKTRWVGFGEKEIFAEKRISTYYDYLSMVDQLEDKTGMTAHFNKIEDVQLLHDSVIDIYNYEQEQKRLVQQKETDIKQDSYWQKKINKWNKWECSDNNYSIISPKHPGELSREGLLLRHCVGGYIQRVLDEKTNIMFLRKNEDVETPFFTIEISNDGVIEQIHGFGNRNVETEPNIIYFIKNWCEKCNLFEKNFNKIR